uniref:PPM-type phosphatase domain-containing protein n=1 Tax=Globodera rostochiensis TaxID=31243 RepID=A0A914HBT6_GLORO
MSAFLRRRMRGLLRTTPNSTDTVSSIGGSDEQQQQQQQQQFRCDEVEEELMLVMKLNGQQQNGRAGRSSESAAVYERILNGRNGRRVESVPEVYSGKTGLDLPSIHLDKFTSEVKACHTGPDGGLTKVQPIRKRAIAAMANLDDEEFSLSSMDEDEATETNSNDRCQNGKRRAKTSLSRTQTDSFEILDIINLSRDGEKPVVSSVPRSSLARYDWNSWDEEKAYGLSTSLYEKHPVTALSAGHPIADVFGIVSRENNAIIALADGVNWGEGARLAARCAIRGAIDHLNAAIERGDTLNTTNDVFHCLLGSFHAAHALILQEGGALTTLCVALVAPVRDSASSVLCACNVGDSLCFVFNDEHGVREVTLASHDIGQMRDMRDAGGALGPVDGRNPQLQNLTCSMTFVRDGDLVFITSDGISDNFDPVVGKFCVIKRSRVDSSEKENVADGVEAAALPPKPAQFFHKTKSAPSANGLLHFSPFPPQHNQLRSMIKRPAAILPSVDAVERHELMLLRMCDVISNGEAQIRPSEESHRHAHRRAAARPCCPGTTTTTTNNENSRRPQSLSAAKRRTLEDPELYRTRTHSKTEERLRRKVIRDMIMEMPGKLDHASVVAYQVGKWPQPAESPTLRRRTTEWDGGMELDGVFVERRHAGGAGRFDENDANGAIVSCRVDDPSPASIWPTAAAICPAEENGGGDGRMLRQHNDTTQQRPVVEQTWQKTTLNAEQMGGRRRRHGRDSEARHTLGVDVSWLKRLVTSKHEQKQQQQLSGTNGNYSGEIVGNEQTHPPTSNGKCQKGTTISSAPVGVKKYREGGGSNFSLRKLRVFVRHQQQPVPSIEQQHQPPRSRQPSPREDGEGMQRQQPPSDQIVRHGNGFLLSDGIKSAAPSTSIICVQQSSAAAADCCCVDRAVFDDDGNVPQPPTVPRMGLGQLLGPVAADERQQNCCAAKIVAPMAANDDDEDEVVLKGETK